MAEWQQGAGPPNVGDTFRKSVVTDVRLVPEEGPHVYAIAFDDSAINGPGNYHTTFVDYGYLFTGDTRNVVTLLESGGASTSFRIPRELLLAYAHQFGVTQVAALGALEAMSSADYDLFRDEWSRLPAFDGAGLSDVQYLQRYIFAPAPPAPPPPDVYVPPAGSGFGTDDATQPSDAIGRVSGAPGCVQCGEVGSGFAQPAGGFGRGDFAGAGAPLISGSDARSAGVAAPWWQRKTLGVPLWLLLVVGGGALLLGGEMSDA